LKARKIFKLLSQTVKWSFIVFCVFIASLFFRSQRIPRCFVQAAVDAYVPENVVAYVDSATFGFIDGLRFGSIRVYDRQATTSVDPVVSVDGLEFQFLQRRVIAIGLTYLRLPSSYYADGNCEKDEEVAFSFPDIPSFELVLERPNVLSVTPKRVVADIGFRSGMFSAERIRLDWPDLDEPMHLDGFCNIDLRKQEIRGGVRGFAKQRHIRPLLEALDIKSALTYVDAFTDVPGKVPASCGWTVNLVNNDFDLELDLDPAMGKYNTVPMSHANGKLLLHVYTRGTSLNYHHTIGPIVATGASGQPLEGTVVVDGFEGTNTVTVSAKSALPIASLLKIGGFVGEYVSEEVVGKSSCELEFRFPRSRADDKSCLNGKGRLEVKDGQIMRLRGFKGLVELLAEKVPGVSWFTDSTQASCDYVIENGVVKSDNIYIEGTLFSMKMYGSYDSVRDSLDFTVRVQFSKKDSVMGKILHPLTWPFTKLLLEFRLKGSTESPRWEYITVIDRVLEVAK